MCPCLVICRYEHLVEWFLQSEIVYRQTEKHQTGEYSLSERSNDRIRFFSSKTLDMNDRLEIGL